LILPSDAVGRVTACDYLRKSRYFLGFAGDVDPKLMHHKSDPGFAVERERAAIKTGMECFIRDAVANPKATKSGNLPEASDSCTGFACCELGSSLN
jgi:hypothetical protein